MKLIFVFAGAVLMGSGLLLWWLSKLTDQKMGALSSNKRMRGVAYLCGIGGVIATIIGSFLQGIH